jgi:hypothetical protein
VLWLFDPISNIVICVPLSVLWLFGPISMENRIWVTGLELCSVDSDSSGLCLVDSGSLW